MNKFSKKLLIYTAAGVVVAGLVVWRQGLFAVEEADDILRIVCDGFFVAGTFLLAWGGLVWAYNGGALDGLGYSAKTLRDRIRPSYEEKKTSFQQYRENREAKAKSPKAELIAGLIHAGTAVLLYLAYALVK